MQFIVASIAKILAEDNENWRNFETNYFRRKPNHSAVSPQPAKPVSVSVTPRRTHLVSNRVFRELPKLNNF